MTENGLKTRSIQMKLSALKSFYQYFLQVFFLFNKRGSFVE
ncbi:hypothetical protein [Cytobacillus sp. Bac17]|nr:hypothetical protein [Cytobacillus sp. Bac17]